MTLYRDQKLSPDNQRLWVAYRHDLKLRNLSLHTISNYYHALYAAENYFKRDLSKLTRLDIKAFLADELDSLAATTVHIHYVALRVFYNFLVREDIINKSPVDGVSGPNVPDNPPKIPTDTDLRKLLSSCNGKSFRDRRDSALFRLCLEPGGLRRAEVIGLSLEDVDIDGQLVTVLGKGSKVRTIGYGNKTGQALVRYIHARSSHKDCDSEALWLGRFGPLTIWSIGQILEVRCKQAGIERIRAHGLRHAATHRAMAAGMSDLNLMTLSGWESPAMLKIYARANKTERALEAARSLALGDRL